MLLEFGVWKGEAMSGGGKAETPKDEDDNDGECEPE